MNLLWLLPQLQVLKRGQPAPLIPAFSGKSVLWARSTGIAALLFGLSGAWGSELGISYFPSNGQAQVSITGGTGQWHRLEGSANLLDWSGLASLFPTNPLTTWMDRSATNFPTRFYRSVPLTPLEVYVAAPDINYSYRVTNTFSGTGSTNWVLDMTSQAWRTPSEVNRTIWKHWLIITKPSTVTNGHALLLITGGSNGGGAPAGADGNLAQLAVDTKSVVAELRMIPNQPLKFAGETGSRSEDALIAYSWDKFLRLGDETWPAQVAMT